MITRNPTDQYLIEYEEGLFTCFYKDFQLDTYGINFIAPSEVFTCLLDKDENLGIVGGLLNKQSAKEMIRFLQDWIDEKI